MPDSNSTVTKADRDVSEAFCQLNMLTGPTWRERVAQLLSRHRQSSSNAGGVDDAEALTELLDDIEDEWIDHYLRPDSAERAKCKRCGGDDFSRSSIEHKPGCLVGRIRAALASLSTPTAEPPPTPDRIGKDAVREAAREAAATYWDRKDVKALAKAIRAGGCDDTMEVQVAVIALESTPQNYTGAGK